MRDLALFAFLAVLVVATFKRPLFGVLGWVLFGMMNPHRLAWGPAYDFAFSQIIALTTLASVLVTKEHRKPKGGIMAALLLIILLLGAVNAFLGFNPPRSWQYMDRVTKTFLFVWLGLLLLHERKHVNWLLATICVSIGFFGVKGGAFVLGTGGNYRVNGPPDSMVTGNNELAVALIVTIPLLYYFYTQLTRPLHRWALAGAISLCAISVIGSYSRGALLGVLGMSFVLWLRSSHKALLGVGVVSLIFVAIPFMPDKWFDRMETIKTYEEDGSASARLVAWETAYNLAKDRFPLGGGMEYETIEVAQKYSPDQMLVMVPHSIYFQTMGGLGFIGLAVWLIFWASVWWQCAWMRRNCKQPEVRWAGQLGSMVQVSLVGYAIGGAFLNLAFWDGMYYLYLAIAVAGYAVKQQMATAPKQPAQ